MALTNLLFVLISENNSMVEGSLFYFLAGKGEIKKTCCEVKCYAVCLNVEETGQGASYKAAMVIQA